jgi:hypothetical protein
MKKMFLLLSLIVICLLLSTCQNTIMTGQTFFGELTKSDLIQTQWYYDNYVIYCSGTWKFTFTSRDDVTIYLEARDKSTNTAIFSDFAVKGETNSITAKLPPQTNVNVYVNQDNPEWAANSYSAKYKLSAALQ